MLEYRYDTQLLIDGEDLDEDEVADYFTKNFKTLRNQYFIRNHSRLKKFIPK